MAVQELSARRDTLGERNFTAASRPRKGTKVVGRCCHNTWAKIPSPSDSGHHLKNGSMTMPVTPCHGSSCTTTPLALASRGSPISEIGSTSRSTVFVEIRPTNDEIRGFLHIHSHSNRSAGTNEHAPLRDGNGSVACGSNRLAALTPPNATSLSFRERKINSTAMIPLRLAFPCLF